MPTNVDLPTDNEWDELVAGVDGELFISRRWIRVLADAFDLDIRTSIERDEAGRVIGLLPYCRLDDLRGPRSALLSFSDFVVPVINEGASWNALIDPIMRIGRPVVFQTTDESPAAADERFVEDGNAIRHSVPLDGDAAELMSRFSQHHRRLVRKSERAGIKYRCAENTNELRAFYDLHLGVRKHKYGMLAQPYRLFESLWENFLIEGLGALMLGFDGSTVVGGCLLLQAGDTLYYKYAASHPDYRGKGASHGAVLAAIDYGVAQGLNHLDLGRSDVDQPGLVDFKQRFGAESSTLRCYRSTSWKSEKNPEIDRLLSDMTTLLTQPTVPDSVTEQAGERLYRLFA